MQCFVVIPKKLREKWRGRGMSRQQKQSEEGSHSATVESTADGGQLPVVAEIHRRQPQVVRSLPGTRY